MKVGMKGTIAVILFPVSFMFASFARTYTFNPAELELSELQTYGRTYTVCFLADCVNDADQPGSPWLPVKDVKFILPPDKQVASVKITTLDSVVVARGILPLPMQYPRLSKVSYEFLNENRTYYNVQSPGVAASVLRHGVSADAHLVTIRLYPVQFNPRGGVLVLYTRVGISLETDPVSSQTMLVHRDSSGQARRRVLLSGMVENPEDVSGFLEQTWNKSGVLSSRKCQEQMAVVTSTRFLSAFDRLAEAKTQRGCSTGVYTIEDIGGAAELLGFVREKVREGSEYILLGGGDGIIPIRNSCYREPFGGANFTDLYYADCSDEAGSDIYTAWDENGNGKYGEPYQNYISVNGISFVDSLNGWMAGRGKGKGSSVIIKTSDGGRNWEQSTYIELGLVSDVYFLSLDRGVIAGDFGVALSNDGGKTWEATWSDEDVQVNAVDFFGEEGWAVGMKGGCPLILRTKDGGISWEEVEGLSSYEATFLTGVDVISQSCVWVVGLNTILRLDISTDHIDFIEEWRDDHTLSMVFTGCAFFNEERGCAYGAGGLQNRIFARAPGLADIWAETTPNSSGSFYVSGAGVLNSLGKIMIVGQWLLISTDYGMSWRQPSNPISPPVNSSMELLESDKNYAWIAGQTDGKDEILRSSNACEQEVAWESRIIPIESGDKGVEEWTPDVALGRLPVVTLEEAQIVVDKIITYENSPPPENYTERALFMAADMEYSHDYSCLVNADDATALWAAKPSRTAYRLFNPISGSGFAGDEIQNAVNARNALESGYNFVYHQDHGTSAQFGTGYKIPGLNPDNRIWAAEIPYFDNGVNSKKQSVIYTAACAVAQYTRLVDPDYPSVGGNIAVEFLRNPRAGAVGFLGGVDDVDRDNGRVMGTNLIGLLLEDQPPSLGWAFENSLEAVGSQSFAYNMHLLGDPSLRPWTDTLARFSDSLEVRIDSRGLNVTVRDEAGKPVSDALVCIYMKEKIYSTGITDDVGEARFTGFIPVNGLLSITVTKQNYMPHFERKVLGGVVNNPITLSSSEIEDYVNARNMAVDAEGNLHLVFTDIFSSRKVVRYAFSADTGSTWSVRLLDPCETNPTRSPALILRNGLHPYVAYLVDKGSLTFLKVTNVESGASVELKGTWGKVDAAPGFLISDSASAHLALRAGSVLYCCRLDLEKVDVSSSAPLLQETYADLPADVVTPQPPSLAVIDAAGTLVVAEAGEDEKSVYYWFPFNSDGPGSLFQGGSPCVCTDGRFVTVGYVNMNGKPCVREGYSLGTLLLDMGAEKVLSQTECSAVNLVSTRLMLWTDSEGLWFSTRGEDGWSEPTRFESTSSTVSILGGYLDLKSGLGAFAWVQSNLIHVQADPLSKITGFPKLVVETPTAYEAREMGIVKGVSWYQQEGDKSVSLELSVDGGTEWKPVAALASSQRGVNYYHWETGRLADLTRIGDSTDNFDDCYIRVKCGQNAGTSYPFFIGEGQAAILRFEQVTDPTGLDILQGEQKSTGWLYLGSHGCIRVWLELSTDNGRTFSEAGQAQYPFDFQGANPQTLYKGEIGWQVPDEPLDSAILRLTAQDTLGNEIYCRSGVFKVLAEEVVDFSLEVVPVTAKEADIRFSLPYAANVSLKVYDVSGQLVTKLVDGEVAPGVHSILWEGNDDLNRRCASGVYFVRFTAGDYVAAKKMVLLK